MLFKVSGKPISKFPGSVFDIKQVSSCVYLAKLHLQPSLKSSDLRLLFGCNSFGRIQDWRKPWRRRSTSRRCSFVRIIGISGTPISRTLFRLILPIVALRCGVRHVFHTCSVKELSMMTCQDTHVALVTCLAVVGVEKVDVLNFVFVLRFSSALEIQWPRLAFCCKMNLTFKLRNVTIALLDSCLSFNK